MWLSRLFLRRVSFLCCVFRFRMRFTPLFVASHQVFESVGFHLVVVDDIDAEVEQVFAVVRGVGDECPHREFEFVEHGFGDISSGVDQSVEEVVFSDGLEVLVGDVKVARAALVKLDVVHGLMLC